MAWRRLGHVYKPDGTLPWARSHAALPTPLHLGGDTFRFYFSARDAEKRSHVGWADVEVSAQPHVIAAAGEPVISPGEAGAFDDSGLSIGCIVRDGDELRLYYMGWNLGIRSPWRNAIGLATARTPDGPFVRYSAGPVVDRTPEDPYTFTYPCVISEGDAWRMWYGSNLSASVADAELIHTLKHAHSNDGVRWQRDGKVVVPLDAPHQHVIVRPSVVRTADGFLMAYASRGERYEIRLSASADGLRWTELPSARFAASGRGWDSEMTCYPALFIHRGRMWMAYNGDHYGANGFGLAVWDGPIPSSQISDLPGAAIMVGGDTRAKSSSEMDMANSELFCPRTHAALHVSADGAWLESPSGDRYPIVDGIASLVLDEPPPNAIPTDQQYYRARAAEYDRGNDAMFRMLLCDEDAARSEITGLLHLKPGARVLEVGCGTCRDTAYLLKQGAQVYASDLSMEMLMLGREHLSAGGRDLSRVKLLRANAVRLPFPDGYFDAVFHFGGLNLFPDVAAALREMARVVKSGGRVVAGDEGTGAWLAETDFAKILQNSNPLFKHAPPIGSIPAQARNVACHWVLNGSFYVLAFDVGEGEPQLDLDVEFPGWRGGSHRSRYYGRLEGVSPALREDVIAAAAAENLSLTAWLEKALRATLPPKA